MKEINKVIKVDFMHGVENKTHYQTVLLMKCLKKLELMLAIKK
ncbi:hypothetical protein [Spiroplasma endosymbiont of Nebria brevicollis]